MTVIDNIRNHSNENISLKEASDKRHENGISFNSNFRTQIPTGAKLMINQANS